MLRWYLDDPAQCWTRVRLSQPGLSREPADLTRVRRGEVHGWELETPRPPVDRIEYRFEVHAPDGRVETINDPANPLRAPGVFGEPSVRELPEYVAPWWLAAGTGEWERTELTARGRGLRVVPVQLCSPTGSRIEDPMPLLVAHDGAEMDALARLTAYASATVGVGAVPAYRVALLPPLDRDNWYSGSTAYGRTLATSVLPLLRSSVAVRGPVVGYGASLGALSMLATQLRHPGTFGGLMLASGSFFHPSDDAHESGFRRYWRIVDRVTDVLEGALDTRLVPRLRVGMVCGTVEENLANNRRMAAALAESGHDVSFATFRDGHNFTAWRDALDPHLTSVLADLWG